MARSDKLNQKQKFAKLDAWLKSRGKTLHINDVMVVVKCTAQVLYDMHQDGLTLGNWDPTSIFVYDDEVSTSFHTHKLRGQYYMKLRSVVTLFTVISDTRSINSCFMREEKLAIFNHKATQDNSNISSKSFSFRWEVEYGLYWWSWKYWRGLSVKNFCLARTGKYP